MKKVFKADLESKKTQHPAGQKTVTVYVSDAMKKDAIVKANDELKFWDPENYKLYKNPKMTEIAAEDAEQALNDYLAKKEQAGQVVIDEQDDQDDDQETGDAESQRIVSELAERAKAIELPENMNAYKVGPDAPNYSEASDRYIEISKYNLINGEILRIGVGVYGNQFLSSFDVSISEKETALLHQIGGDLHEFADKIFTKKSNAITYGYVMAIDYLNGRITSLNKSLMRKDAIELEWQVQKLSSCDLVELFTKNTTATRLPIIDKFCTLPAGLQQNLPADQDDGSELVNNEPETAENLPDSSETLPDEPVNIYHDAILQMLEYNDGLKDFSKEQIDEMTEKLEQVTTEFVGLNRFTAEQIIDEMLNVDWDSAYEIAKTMLNVRYLRAFIRDDICTSNEVEKEEVTKPETKPQPAPETKPFAPAENTPKVAPETKPQPAEEIKAPAADQSDDVISSLGIETITPAEEKESDAKPEPTQLEKDIAAQNDAVSDLAPGETIIFEDLQNAVYHGSDGISSTKLKDACISMMYYNGVHNTGEIEKKRGTHFDVGNLAHTLILEPEKVDIEYKVKPEMPEPTDAQRKKYDAWAKDGKPENQNLKPTQKIIDAVESWMAAGKPENQSLKPSDKIIEKVESYGLDPENAAKPTDGQKDQYDAWMNAGFPEPYNGKPTDKQIADYQEWANAGKPEPYKDKPTDICIERCEFWERFTAENKNLIVVEKEDWKIAENMAQSVRNHNIAGKFIAHPHRVSERSYYKKDEETGLLIKVRPDIEIDNVLGDVKTIQMRGNPDEKWLLAELRREILRRKYHVSAAMYLDVTGAKQFVWVFVNKEPGYHWVAVVKMSMQGTYDQGQNYQPSLYEQGMEIYKEKLSSIKSAQDANYWPAPASILDIAEI